MKKNLRKSLILVLLLMMVICVSAVFAETPTKDATEAYPATPEGVVKAFVEAILEGAETGLIEEGWKKVNEYTTWTERGGSDTATIVSAYKIRLIEQKLETAKVEVKLSLVGNLFMRGKQLTKNIERRTIIYELKKIDNKWRITEPYGAGTGFLSSNMIIKWLQQDLKYETDDAKIKRTKEIINFLKKVKKTTGGKNE